VDERSGMGVLDEEGGSCQDAMMQAYYQNSLVSQIRVLVSLDRNHAKDSEYLRYLSRCISHPHQE
jgi:hypothetical protein